MTEVADKTLLVFSTFAHTQWQVDDLAGHRVGVDDAVRAALEETRGRTPEQVIRSWEKKNQKFLHEMREKTWFNEESWHGFVLARRLDDRTRPRFFEFYSQRELGYDGLHEHFVNAYKEVKRLRDFLAHNIAMRAKPDDERLIVNWFHTEPMGAFMEEDFTRLNLSFMSEAVEVAEWLLDIAMWTFWKLGWNGNAEIRDSKGIVFSDTYAPSAIPPHELGIPLE